MGGREEVVFSRLDPSMQFTRLNRLRLRPARMPRSKRVKPTSLKKKRNPSPTEMSVDSWSSPHETAAAAAPEPHAHSATHTPHHPDQDPDPDHDQDQDPHPDKLCLDSFWSEVETIRQGSGDPDQDQDQDQDPDQDRRDSRHSEEGEQEEQWLAEAGLSTLLKEDSVEEVGEEVLLLSTLTRTQAEAVQRRLDSYTLSLRKRNKPPPRDVRDIFNSPKKQSLRPERSEDSAHHSMASTKTPLAAQTVAPVEEFFLTDVAYCEQAVILLKQAKLPQNNSQRRREDGTLPRVICPKCRLGVTRIQDLSHGDMKKVRQLALIDMTALSDLLEVDVKRHKTGKRKNTESCLYGVPLVTLLENDQKIKANTTTPLYMQALLSFLEKKGVDSEGILRVPGSQSRIKLLQQHLESNFYSGHVIWEDVSPNDAAALLKKFIRELPAPLLTAEYLNTFSAVREITELRQKLHMLNLLILLLPEPNRNTLKALLEFLSKVVSREKKNRMNLWAVSTIMAPNLFLHKAVPSRLTDGAEKNQAEKAADVMRLLIRYQDLLWTIPNFLMRQVRKLNENSNKRYQFYDRRIKNLLRKIHTDSRDKPDKTTAEPCRTVKIQVGDHVTGSMEFQINVNSRASDLIAHFQRQNLPSPDHAKGKVRRNGSMAFPDCSLYEVGGNIGEHCLDPDTHLLDLYNSNAGGEWVIRLKANASR